METQAQARCLQQSRDSFKHTISHHMQQGRDVHTEESGPIHGVGTEESGPTEYLQHAPLQDAPGGSPEQWTSAASAFTSMPHGSRAGPSGSSKCARSAGTTHSVLLRQNFSMTGSELALLPIFPVVGQMPSLNPAAQPASASADTGVPQEAKRILSIVLPSRHPSFSTSFSATSPHRAAVGTGGGGGGTSHSPRTTCRNGLCF